jgi:hypothetical protein
LQHYVIYNYMFRPCKWVIIRWLVEPVRWLYKRSLVLRTTWWWPTYKAETCSSILHSDTIWQIVVFLTACICKYIHNIYIVLLITFISRLMHKYTNLDVKIYVV